MDEGAGLFVVEVAVDPMLSVSRGGPTILMGRGVSFAGLYIEREKTSLKY